MVLFTPGSEFDRRHRVRRCSRAVSQCAAVLGWQGPAAPTAQDSGTLVCMGSSVLGGQ